MSPTRRPTRAASGSSHFVFAFGSFVGTVQHTVCGQDEVCTAADVQAFGELITGVLEFASLGHEQVGCDDASVTYDVDFSFIEDARRDRAEHKFLSLEDDGMSGVGTSGKACHNVISRCEIIDHLSFAFIAKDDAQQSVYFSFCHVSKNVRFAFRLFNSGQS